MKSVFTATALLSCLASPLAAQERETVRASDPSGMVAVLTGAGYDATLTKDAEGDPLIKVVLSGYKSNIYFYGCDETTHDDCDSIGFSAGYDLKDGWTAEQAIKLSGNYRFMALALDEENDPYVSWDVEIGEGIPRSVFLRSVMRFTETVTTAGDAIFGE